MSPKKSKTRDLESLLLEYERQITDDTVLAHSRLAECTEGYFDVLDFWQYRSKDEAIAL